MTHPSQRDVAVIQESLNSPNRAPIIATDSEGMSHRITDAKSDDDVLYGYHPKTGLWFPIVAWNRQSSQP